MTPEQFAYWLQGFCELTVDIPNQGQWESIKEHLATVFNKVTTPVVIPPLPQQIFDTNKLNITC